MSNKKGVSVKKLQYKKGQIIISKSTYNGIGTYIESNYYSIKPIIITLLVIIAIITSHLSIII